MLKKLFLPVGLLAAMGAACLLPAPGAWLRAHAGVQVFVITIFLVNGWTVRLGGSHFNRRLAGAMFAACVLSLGVGPWLGLWVGRDLFGLSGLMGLGMVVMASVPVTLSSAIVISSLAGGNQVWALLMTMGMNLVGIFTVPAMLKLCLSESATTSISASALLLKLLILVLMPFIIGHIAHRLLRWRTPSIVGYVPSLCVILTVYAAFAASRDDVFAADPRTFPILLLAALTIHLLLFAAALLLGRLMGQGTPERRTLCFVSSQKSLPIAVSVLAALTMDSALALLPCLIFHFSQLLLDSCIAAKWGHPRRGVLPEVP